MLKSIKRRGLLGLLAAGSIAASLFAPGAALAEAEVTLRMHQFLPLQANVPKLVLDVWAKQVEEASEGRIKIEHYPSMQLGGTPPELYDQAVDGVADIVWTVLGYTAGRFPEAEVFELPFMTSGGAEAASRALWRFGEETFIGDEMGDTKVLALWVHGPGLIHSKDPIVKVGDLKGVKLRSPTRVTNMMFTNLGAESISMPVPAVPENLSKGVISAAVIPWEVTLALKTSELVKNHTTFPGEALYATTFVLAMNKAKYESLPDDLKKVIDENSGVDLSGFAGKTQEEADGPGLKFAQEAGNNIIDLSEADVAEWKAAAAPTIEQWQGEMDEKGFEGAAIVERARALIAEERK